MTVSLDHLGENVLTREDAERAHQAYTNALDRIAAENLNANVSLKLTHLGLDLGDEFARGSCRLSPSAAAALGILCAWIWKDRNTQIARCGS